MGRSGLWRHVAESGARASWTERRPIARLAAALRATLVPGVLPVLALIGLVAVLVATRWGAGLAPDSVRYLSMAEQLESGNGFTSFHEGSFRPETHYPPLLSGTLALFSLLGATPLTAARLLNAVALSISVLLIAALINKVTRGSRTAALVGAALMVLSVDLLHVHAMALSEALFILLNLCFLVLLMRYVEAPTRGTLIGLSVVAGLALLDRYLGFAVLATGVIGVLAFPSRSHRGAAKDVAVFLTIASTPIVAWLIRAAMIDSTLAGRTIQLTAPDLADARVLLVMVTGWLFPVQGSGPVLAGLLLLPALALAWMALWLRRTDPRKWRGTLIVMLNIGALLGVLIAGMTLIATDYSFIGRQISMVHVLAIVVVVTIVDHYVRHHARTLRAVSAGLLVALIVVSGARSALWVRDSFRDGLVYQSPDYLNSQLMAAVDRVPPGVEIVSNAPEAVYAHTRRMASALPSEFDPRTERRNPDFEQDMNALEADTRSGEAVIVYFRPIGWKEFMPTLHEVKSMVDVEPARDTSFGVMLRAERPSARGPG
ncbi:MAG: ArnT family glycosyltransferase [Actinomycetota bacterium]